MLFENIVLVWGTFKNSLESAILSDISYKGNNWFSVSIGIRVVQSLDRAMPYFSTEGK